ncbi:MAG: PAS domain-containing protein, partial [Deltaproteobacteria bacterium]|nr:PAS domain-containing protein [Deltaproteobacteria bacterium]
MKKNIKISTAILEAFDDGIFVMDQELKVEYMNSAMVEEFGDGISKKCHELLNQSDGKCPWCRSDEVFEGNKIGREVFVSLTNK